MSAQLKAKLSRGETVLGQMVLELFTPGMAQMMDRSGLEFCIYDMEHGRCDISLAAQMIASCNGSRCSADSPCAGLTAAPYLACWTWGRAASWFPVWNPVRRCANIVAQSNMAPDGRRGVALGITHDHFRTPDPSYLAGRMQTRCDRPHRNSPWLWRGWTKSWRRLDSTSLGWATMT